jgi:hypothetical protein
MLGILALGTRFATLESRTQGYLCHLSSSLRMVAASRRTGPASSPPCGWRLPPYQRTLLTAFGNTTSAAISQGVGGLLAAQNARGTHTHHPQMPGSEVRVELCDLAIRDAGHRIVGIHLLRILKPKTCQVRSILRGSGSRLGHIFLVGPICQSPYFASRQRSLHGRVRYRHVFPITHLFRGKTWQGRRREASSQGH